MRRGPRPRRLVLAVLGAGLLGSFAASPLRSEEPSPASGGAPDPGVHQVAFEERAGELVLRQYHLASLSHLSYLLGAGGEAVVVDPSRDVGVYVRDAEALGLEITTVVLTHTHADFVAGHAELAARAGATVLVRPAGGAGFPHRPVEDGDHLVLGSVTLELWATPGPTQDGLTVLVRAGGADVEPLFALTGDTLLVGSAGRPDALDGETLPLTLADRAFDSVRRLDLLPDGTRILPAHGSGPFGGERLGPETVSTLGHERATNPYLGIESRARFVARLLDGLPRPPRHASRVAALNRAGPPLLAEAVRLPVPVSAPDLARASAAGGWIVDLRPPAAYAAGHVEGSLNVALDGPFETWVGATVPEEADLYVVGDEREAAEAARRLARVGRDRPRGRLEGGVEAWGAAGLALRTSLLVSAADLARLRAAWIEPVLVDVRSARAYGAERIEGCVNVPMGALGRCAALFERSRPLLLVCLSGYRSSIAVGLLERRGFERLGSLDGGLKAWREAGLETIPR